jgi:hypothetical protein
MRGVRSPFTSTVTSIVPEQLTPTTVNVSNKSGDLLVRPRHARLASSRLGDIRGTKKRKMGMPESC